MRSEAPRALRSRSRNKSIGAVFADALAAERVFDSRQPAGVESPRDASRTCNACTRLRTTHSEQVPFCVKPYTSESNSQSRYTDSTPSSPSHLRIGFVLLSTTLRAHGSSIAGVVRDTTGSVLPGVVAEAAIPALI